MSAEERENAVWSLAELEQEISNWTHYWLRKSAERFSEFLLPATAKPIVDFIDPAWTLKLPDAGSQVISFVSKNPHDNVTNIMSMVNNPVQHGAWLSSWYVQEAKKQNGSVERGIWQPDELQVMVDIDNHSMILRQIWKNPRYMNNVIIGMWQENDLEWQIIIDTLKNRGDFRVMLPGTMQTYQTLQGIQERYTKLDKPMELMLVYWLVHKVLFRKEPDSTETFPHDGSHHRIH